MGLNIGASGGFKTFIKYNAKAGRWFLRDSDGDKEIPMPLGFVADVDNIATGWMKYQEGQAPQRRFDPDLQTPAPSPGEGFKRGFVMMVFSARFSAARRNLAATPSISPTPSRMSTPNGSPRVARMPASCRLLPATPSSR